MRTIFLFLVTNLAILVVAGFILSVFGIGSYIEASTGNLNTTNLLIFCAVFGFAGSFVSLLLSKWIAKRSTRCRIITQPANTQEKHLLQCVEELAKKAGIGMPEVGIFPATDANAFATGASRNKALVAVSQGMLDRFNKEEVGAVLAHEIGHIANGDMITMALLQGVINTFVMFFARIIGFFVDRVILKNERGFGIGFFITTIVAEIVLAILASTIVMWFSRKREFRADYASAKLTHKTHMIAALERLRAETMPAQLPDTMLAFGISSNNTKKLKGLFASHPPLAKRISALQSLAD